MPEKSDYITRNIVLDEETLAIVEQLVTERHFGGQGFSLAVRTIIREWAEQIKLKASIAENYGRLQAALSNPQVTWLQGGEEVHIHHNGEEAVVVIEPASQEGSDE